jgi:hypothetical protein
VELHERELVPIAALKSVPSVDDAEKTAAAQSFRVAPFQDCSFSVLEEILWNADHLGGRKAGREHRSNVFMSLEKVGQSLSLQCRRDSLNPGISGDAGAAFLPLDSNKNGAKIVSRRSQEVNNFRGLSRFERHKAARASGIPPGRRPCAFPR